MTYQEYTDWNITNATDLFTYIANTVPYFMPMMLFTIGFIVGLSTFFTQIRIKGRGNAWSSFAVASYFTSIIAIILSFIPNLINAPTVIITITISILATGILLNQENK